VQLGRWALDTATQTLADWDLKTGTRLPISVNVNLSPVQISRDDVAAAVSGALSASGIDGDRLTLELTEGAIIQDPERVARALKSLQRFDVKIAMDDFGSGYTSLASLQLLPIDILKIDQRFVSGMLADGDSAAIVDAILSLARALGMATTAEGIESEALAAALLEKGCTYGQGYLYSEALPADEALAYWLDRNN
jgi:EAL domain-containing protein (putative c-di-GMP-specific phosphodiesterase class I)